MTQLKTVDIFKFVMAFLVVAIHARALCGISFTWDAANYALCLAVPFFFITSGYLLGRKLDTAKSRQEQAAIFSSTGRKYAMLYLRWLLVFLPIAVIEFTLTQDTAGRFIFDYVAGVLFFGESPYSWPLWFVFSMAVSTATIAFVLRHNWSVLWLVALGALSAIVDWMIDCDTPLLTSSERLVRYAAYALRYIAWRPFAAILFLLAGIAVYRWRERIVNCGTVALCLLVGVTLFVSHLPFWKHISGMAVFVAALLIQVPSSAWWLRLRRYSTIIYFVHMLAGYAALRLWPLPFAPSDVWAVWCAMAAASLAIGVVINYLMTHAKVQWLERLF